MTWRIEFTADAVAALKRLDKPVRRRLVNYLETRIAPAVDPRASGKALRGQLGDFWRYRVGDYRILCRINDRQLLILVIDAAHRSAVYE